MFRLGISTVRVGVRSLGTRGTIGAPSILRTRAVNVGSLVSTQSTGPISLRYNSTSTTSEITDKLVSFKDEVAEVGKQVSNMHSNEIGYLDSIGLAQGMGPTALVERLLEYTYVYTGLPWWGTIIASTILIRIVLFPLYMSASTNAAKMSKAKPELDQVMKDLKAAKNPQDQFNAVRTRKKIMKDHDINTFKQLAPVVQLPLAYGFFQALRKMAAYPVEGFNTEGYSWFVDLTQVDPYLGLHFISAGLIFTVIKLGGETGGQAALQGGMKKILMVLPFASILFTKSFAAAVVLYFTVNSLFSLVQTTLFKSTTFRKMFNMPPMVKPVVIPGQPQESALDSFREMMKKTGDEATTKSRDTASKLEKLQKRKMGANYEFVKRHDK
jgi:YidC/Oxa1 family membrane protein insertase